MLSLPRIFGVCVFFVRLRWGARCLKQWGLISSKWLTDRIIYVFSHIPVIDSSCQSFWATTLRELTYSLPRHFWRWCSFSQGIPRWDMLVPWRVSRWNSCISYDFCSCCWLGWLAVCWPRRRQHGWVIANSKGGHASFFYPTSNAAIILCIITIRFYNSFPQL